MTDDEILEAIHQACRKQTEPARLGRHRVRILATTVGQGPLTRIFRISNGRIVLLRAAKGSYRADVAIALLDAVDRVPADPGDTVHLRPLQVDGFPLDRAAVLHPADEFRSRPELGAITTLAVPAHRSEIRPGESREDFQQVTDGILRLPLSDWSRPPTPRADARILDEWPGGRMYPTEIAYPWPAENQLDRVAREIPAGIRLELTDVRGHRLILTRDWDRTTGTLFPADGTPLPVDIPRLTAWPRLGPIFSGAPLPQPSELIVPGSPEQDVLGITYHTTDCGHADLPFLETLANCEKRITNHILRTPGNWAVFRSRSDAVIQLRHEDHDPPLWLETPYPDKALSRGRHVTRAEATRLLTVLAREDRSPVPDLDDLQTVPWNTGAAE